MNRRSFLAGLGLAPVVASGAAVAAPKSFTDVGFVGPIKGYATGMSYVGEAGPEAIIPLRSGTATLGVKVDIDDLRADIQKAVREAMAEHEHRLPSLMRGLTARRL